MIWEIEISMRTEEDLDEEAVKKKMRAILEEAGLDVAVDRAREV